MEEDQYGISDLRHFIAGRTLFPAISQQQNLIPDNRAFPISQPYDMLMFRPDNCVTLNGNSTATTPAATSGGFLIPGSSSGGDAANGRWPRQETLTLLEIRSKLDSKFKETNQKGPLWDEVSRIMSEEHGYQRSGKKCREKFQNLYKYYKKTKEGKAGRQDGKHYRFYRQLEAMYGESNISGSASESQHGSGSFQYNFRKKTTNQQGDADDQKLSETSLSLSNYSDNPYESSAEDSEKLGNDASNNMDRISRRSWKVKIRDFIDSHMKKLIDKQEAWMEKMMRTLEDKDKERTLREEGWRKQDAARIELRQQLWARERAWMKSRDTALMDALHKLAGETTATNLTKVDTWSESEVNKLIQLRTSMEMQRGVSEEMIWKEISSRMACFGYEKSPLACKEKWESVNNYVVNKRRENYFDPFTDEGGGGGAVYLGNETGFDQTIIRLSDHHHQVNNSSPNRSNVGALSSDNLFRYFMGDGNGRIGD